MKTQTTNFTKLLDNINSQIERLAKIDKLIQSGEDSVQAIGQRYAAQRESLGTAQAQAEIDGASDTSLLTKLVGVFKSGRDELEIAQAKIAGLQRERVATATALLGLEAQLAPELNQYVASRLEELERQYIAAGEQLAVETRRIAGFLNSVGKGVPFQIRELTIPLPSNPTQAAVEIFTSRFVYDRHVIQLPDSDDPIAARVKRTLPSLKAITDKIRGERAEAEKAQQERERQQWVDSQPTHDAFDGAVGSPAT